MRPDGRAQARVGADMLSSSSRDPSPQANARTPEADELHVARALEGRTIFMTGGIGFVGKVTLAMLLVRAPGLPARRPPDALGARPEAHRRAWRKPCEESPAFAPVRAKYPKGLPFEVVAVEGDVTKPRLGLSDGDEAHLNGDVDLVFSLAAELGYTAPLDVALATNVFGAFEAASLARRWGAGLVHVSTCFAAPDSFERVPEEKLSAIEDAGTSEWRAAEAESVQVRRGRPGRRAQIDAALRRARAGGWPNTYAYTKWIAETVLLERFSDVRLAIVRPSIVESALCFPEPGWNEDFKSTAPLAWALDGWFRAISTRSGVALDIVPVDEVARGIAVVGAKVLIGSQRSVYNFATGIAKVALRRRDRAIDLAGRLAGGAPAIPAQTGLTDRSRAG